MITRNESAVLKAILNSEYNDGNDTSAIWTFSVWDNIDRTAVPDRKSLGGIIASLVKKGLVSEGGRGSDATIQLTAAGLAEVGQAGAVMSTQRDRGPFNTAQMAIFDAVVQVGGNAVARRVPRDVASLIAAAPELLAALRECADAMEAHGYVPPCLNRARAAIAKVQS